MKLPNSHSLTSCTRVADKALNSSRDKSNTSEKAASSLSIKTPETDIGENESTAIDLSGCFKKNDDDEAAEEDGRVWEFKSEEIQKAIGLLLLLLLLSAAAVSSSSSSKSAFLSDYEEDLSGATLLCRSKAAKDIAHQSMKRVYCLLFILSYQITEFVKDALMFAVAVSAHSNLSLLSKAIFLERKDASNYPSVSIKF
ncbi:hypothetical protein Emed_000033 [Eimeria media]